MDAGKKRRLLHAVWVLFLGLLILILGGTGAYAALDFGSFEAAEEMSKSVAYSLPMSLDQLKGFNLWLEQDLLSKESGQVLRGNRLALEMGRNTYELSTSPLFIERTEDWEQSIGIVPLLFYYRVYPWDKPGTYESVLRLQCAVLEGSDWETTVPIRVHVKPWLRVESDTQDLRIDAVTEGYIVSSMPGVVKVASNEAWELYVAYEDRSKETYGLLEMVLSNRHDSGASFLYPRGLILDQRYIPVVRGMATVDGESDYWLNLAFLLRINEYVGIQAGNLYLPLSFYLMSVE